MRCITGGREWSRDAHVRFSHRPGAAGVRRDSSATAMMPTVTGWLAGSRMPEVTTASATSAAHVGTTGTEQGAKAPFYVSADVCVRKSRDSAGREGKLDSRRELVPGVPERGPHGRGCGRLSSPAAAREAPAASTIRARCTRSVAVLRDGSRWRLFRPLQACATHRLSWTMKPS